MHLSDGVIGNQASLTFIGMSGVFAFWAIKQVKSRLFEKIKVLAPQLATEFGSSSAPKISSRLQVRPQAKKIIPKLVMVFSLVYAVQLFDFPIINGVSGHLIGAALAGIVLGPALGALTVAAVLAVQAVFLGDGGLLALGANIFNMAVVGSAGGYYFFILAKKYLPNYASIFFAAFFSVIFSALAFGLIMFISRQIIISQLFSEILWPHAIIGLIEGLLTVVVIKFILTTNSYKS